jgi:hypothetical protein
MRARIPGRLPSFLAAIAVVGMAGAGACGGDDAKPGATTAGDAGPTGPRDGGNVFEDGSVAPSASCRPSGGSGPVQAPTFVRNIRVGEAGWFGSPAVVDLDRDGKKELILTLYSTFVYSADGRQLAKGTATQGRIYAPGVVADLDGDGVMEIVVGGNQGSINAYEFRNGALSNKAGWPASTTSGGQSPETRGMAAADLDGDGTIEVVATTTNTSRTGAQVFVFSPNGTLYQPPGTAWTAWPRYNAATGPGGDVDFNGYGNHGFGCYGLNVGIGNLDDDPKLEIVVTYDNHQINVFKPDGSSVLASDWYTNRQTQYAGRRMGWGQFIRWRDAKVEDDHYHLHTGPWPDVKQTMWLQMTASPPNVVDVDGDGKNDVVLIPNAEQYEPYETQGYAFMVLQGAHGDGSRAARRLPAFEAMPFTDKPAVRAAGDYYPPDGVPAPTTVNILGDARPEIVAPINDGYVYAIGPDAKLLWKFDYAKGVAETYASEVVVADLNKDGVPELVFGTYSPQPNGGRLFVLANTGALLFEISLPGQGTNGNGIGVPAAPTLADLDGNGTLEILVQTFDHGVDVFSVPGSEENCQLWPTGRGGWLRNGQAASGLK